MSGLSFLKNITIQPNSAVKTATARTSSAEAKNPTNADIRVYKNGAVYPSAKLVSACDLQFYPRPKLDEEGKLIPGQNQGNGFDIFSSADFINTQSNADKCLFIAMVPRSLPKVDLFSSTKFDEADQPTADVLTQGAVTFGVVLLEMIKEVYGITIPETGSYIDLVIANDYPFTTDNNIYFVPKRVSRGPKKGQVDLLRREDLTLYPLVPKELTEDVTEKTEPIEQSSNTVQSNEPSLSEIEAENDGTVSPAAKLPAGTLEDDGSDGTGFVLEGDIEDAPSFEDTEDEDDDTLTV